MMKIAFYKGKKRIFNRLVSWWTNGPYSHVELVMPDGYCYTSSFMDGGVRRKYIHFDEHSWDFITIDESLNSEKVLEKIKLLYGTRYDILGIIGFVIRKVKDSKSRMFCSEFVLHVLGFEESWRYDPNTAYSALGFYVNERK